MNQNHARRQPRGANAPPRRKGDPMLSRLIVAIVLFLLCFVGKTSFPHQTEAYRHQLAALLSGSTDLHSAFAELGTKLEQREEVMNAVGDWCVSVFGPGELTVPPKNSEVAERH